MPVGIVTILHRIPELSLMRAVFSPSACRRQVVRLARPRNDHVFDFLQLLDSFVESGAHASSLDLVDDDQISFFAAEENKRNVAS